MVEEKKQMDVGNSGIEERRNGIRLKLQGMLCKAQVSLYTVFSFTRYYLSRSRYSPLFNSLKKAPAGPAFGSSAPRWLEKPAALSSKSDSTCDLQLQVSTLQISILD